MQSDTQVVVIMAVMAITFVAGIAWLIAANVPYMFKDKSRFNSTDDWTPAPDNPVKTPTMTSLIPYERRILEEHLEAGETLEGFARAFFIPHRSKDWRFGSALEKLPLLVAATSSRILLFEVRLLTVYRYRFITYEEIEYLQPPKPGFLGTSGRMRLGLKSGHEYQMGFFGPLLSDEGMRLEQSMAAQFRRIAPQFASSPTTDSAPRVAA